MEILASRWVDTTRYIKEQFINIVYGAGNNGLLVVYSGDCYYSDVFNCFIDKNIPNPPENLLFKIKYFQSTKKYQIYLNDQLLIESIYQTEKRPKKIWFGSPFFGENYASWVPFRMRFISILSTNNNLSPIIFLPGYFGSWNLSDLINNSYNNIWTRSPLEMAAGVYSNFFDTLRNLGYQEGVDFARWDYNFTRPLPEISAKFNTFLNDFLADKPEGTKVILIGHSFGGLLAKEYVNDFGTDKVEKIITVGSPHEGVLDTYPLLAAGDEMKNLAVWQKFILNTYYFFHNENYLTKRQMFENLLPSAKDLLPIFDDYLKNKDDEFISSTLQNPHLSILKTNFNQPDILKIIRGVNLPTKRYYVLEPRDKIDEFLDLWPDGKVVQTLYDQTGGDGTVLSQSSYVSNAKIIDIPGKTHSEIILTKEGIKKVLDEADISYTDDKIANTSPNLISQGLMFLLKSPAKIKVKDLWTGKEIGFNASNDNLIDNAVSMENDKIIFVPSSNLKRYQIDVTGTDFGKYQLDISAIAESTNSAFLSFVGETQNEQKDTFQIKYHEGANLVSISQDNIYSLYLSLRENINNFQNFASGSFFSSEINDLSSDADLLLNLYLNNKKSQTSQVILRMIMKVFKISKYFVNFSADQKLEFNNYVLKIALSLKDIFAVTNNSQPFVDSSQTSRSFFNLESIFPIVKDQLFQKIVKHEANEFSLQDFKSAEEYFELAKRESFAGLNAEAFISSQLTRYLLTNSLQN